MDKKYDAFISYKHGDLDGAIALKLQTLLEHLKVPSYNKKESKRIERVFLDTGELSSSSDFVEQVETALKEAEWLIVICSPGSKSSPWCKLEVDTFLKYHDMSHILLLLSEGEPDEVFPDRLLAEEMTSLHILAADARGKDKKEALKKLKKEALYKLAAPMFGVSYDDLKQRRKAYLMQRIAAVSAFAFAILACFTAYIIYQSGQISLNFNKAQKNQARYMATISADMLASGDRDAAILTANAILPEHPEEGPLVPEQFYPLNRALGSFKGRNEYLPHSITETGLYINCAVSEDEKYTYILKKDTLTVFSNDSEDAAWTFTLADAASLLDQGLQSGVSGPAFKKLIPYKNTLLFLQTGYELLLLDTEKHTLVYSINDLETTSLFDLGGDSLAVLTYAAFNSEETSRLQIYEAETGKEKYTCSLAEYEKKDFGENPTYDNLTVSPDGEQAMLTCKRNELRDISNTQYYIGTILINLKDDTQIILSDSSAEKIAWLDKDRVGLILSGDSAYGGSYHYLDKSTDTAYRLQIANRSDGSICFNKEWKIDSDLDNASIEKLTLSTDGLPVEAALFTMKGDLTLINLADYSVLANLSFHSEIIDTAETAGGSFYAALTTGQVQQILLTGEDTLSSNKVCGMDSSMAHYYYLEDAAKFVFLTENQIIYCENKTDPYYEEMVLPSNTTTVMQDIEYVAGGENTWRIVYHTSGTDTEYVYKPNGFSVYSVGEKLSAYDYFCESGYVIDHIEFREIDGHLVCAMIEYNQEDRSFSVQKLDLTGKEVLFSSSLNDFHQSSYTPVCFSDDLMKLYVANDTQQYSKGLSILDLSGSEIQALQTDVLENCKIQQAVWTGDYSSLVLLAQNEQNEVSCFCYDPASLACTEVAVDPSLLTYAPLVILTPGRSSSSMLLHLGDTACYLFDTRHPDEVISLGEDISRNVGFFDQDQYLIYIRNGTLYLYSIAEGKDYTSYSNEKLDLETMSLCSLVTDESRDFFALNYPNSYWRRTINDDGMIYSPMYTFYVDKNRNLYLYSSSIFTYISPAGKEVCLSLGDKIFYTDLYSYEQLCEHADKLLNGKQLSDAEIQALLTAD